MQHEEMKQNLIEQGKKMGLKPGDIRVLSTDPFFVGSKKDYEDANWAAGLWDKMMAKRKKPLHLRGFHYWVQSQGIAKPDGVKYAYVDPAKDWSYLLHCAQVARYLGIGEWKNLVDLKHPDPTDFDNYWVGSGLSKNGEIDIQTELNVKLEGLVDEFLRELLSNAPRYYDDGYQMYHLEVMCEKNSMRMVLEPACKKYGACYQPFVGQASVEKINMMASRAVRAARAGKKVRLFYIADWDRYGCFSGSTRISCLRNEKKMRDVTEGETLVTHDNGKIVETKVVAKEEIWIPIENLALLKVELTTGVNRGKQHRTETIITTKKHPILTLNRGYVNTEELSSSDILPDIMSLVSHVKNSRPRPVNSIKRRQLIADNPDFLETLRKQSRAGAKVIKEKYGGFPPQAAQELHRIKEENPERWAEIRASNMASLKSLPSNLEKQFMGLVKDLPIEYTGNGKLFVHGFCPDFRVKTDHKLIELSDPHFLKAIGKDYDSYKKERQEAYSRDGYKTLFLAYEGDFEPLIKAAREFAVNGARVVSVSPVTFNHIAFLRSLGEVRISNMPWGKETQVKMFNIHCNPHQSFIAKGVTVHNWSMVSAVARKIEFMTQGEDFDIKLTRLALNEEHIDKYNLPKAPKHGEAVVELDALEAIYPGALGEIVEQALMPYYDDEKPKIVNEENKRIREQVRGMLDEKLKAPLQEAFAEIDLEGIAGEVQLTDAINPEFKPPQPGHEVDDGNGWVYDSARGYWEQLDEYKHYKGERIEEEA